MLSKRSTEQLRVTGSCVLVGTLSPWPCRMGQDRTHSSGPKKMTQWVKCLLYQCEDLG